MKKFGFHAFFWLGCLGFAAVAGAQSAQLTAAELTAKADQMGQQTFTRKNGEVLTFQKIRELPDKEKDVVLDDEMSEAVFEVFDKYITSILAASKAGADEAKKLHDVAKAEANEAKKLRDAAVAELAGKAENLANTIRQAIVLKIQLDRSYRIMFENALNIEGVADRLKPETLSFLKSVLARPELFRDK
jgi:hypothetical protein